MRTRSTDGRRRRVNDAERDRTFARLGELERLHPSLVPSLYRMMRRTHEPAEAVQAVINVLRQGGLALHHAESPSRPLGHDRL